jgi:RNA ligase
MMFKQIKTIDDVSSLQYPMFVRMAGIEGTTTISYVVQTPETFALGEGYEERIEGRGIVFDRDGKLISRPLHKFRNVGETEHTQIHAIDWTQVDRVMIKVDGSMLVPVMIDGQIFWKTKKSWDAPHCNVALAAMKQMENGTRWVYNMLAKSLTPVFELVSPELPQIVVRYLETKLVLLHVRDNETGRYLTQAEIMETDPPFNMVIDEKQRFMENGVFQPALMQKEIETGDGFEGFVIQFTNGDMVKWKTDWYRNLHHQITFLRERDIAEAVVNDTFDDLRAAAMMAGISVERFDQIQQQVLETVRDVRAAVETIVQAHRELSKKDFAIMFKNHPQRALLMLQFDGREIDWMEWYGKNMLKTWQLVQI